MSVEPCPDPKHVILDSAVFITAYTVPVLQRLFSSGSQFITIREVLDEIRDASSRDRLRALPFRIETREPSSEALVAVVKFARETGDISVLSMTDLKVLALTYQLEVEHHGTERIRPHPRSSRTILPNGRPARRTIQPPSSGNASVNQVTDELDRVAIGEGNAMADTDQRPGTTPSLSGTQHVAHEQVATGRDPEASDRSGLAETSAGESDHDTGRDHCAGEVAVDNDDDSDGGPWITVQNLHGARRGAGRHSHPPASLLPATASSSSSVSCMTTDFAMQNVLVQMGLRLTALDGRTITNLSQWLLRCCACMKMTAELERIFCPSCGGQTLTRSRVKVTSGGWIKYRHSAPKRSSLRGTIYSIPKPRGGRNSSDLILREDQLLRRVPQMKKKKSTEDLFEEASEFAWRKTGAGLRHYVGHPRGQRVNEPVKRTSKTKNRR